MLLAARQISVGWHCTVLGTAPSRDSGVFLPCRNAIGMNSSKM